MMAAFSSRSVTLASFMNPPYRCALSAIAAMGML